MQKPTFSQPLCGMGLDAGFLVALWSGGLLSAPPPGVPRALVETALKNWVTRLTTNVWRGIHGNQPGPRICKHRRLVSGRQMDDVDWRVDDTVTKVRQVEVRGMTRRWTCAVGHRVEANTEEELVRRVQEHMRQDHGMEVSREHILRDLREED